METGGGATKNIDFDAMDQAGVRPEHLINDTQYFWKIRRHIFRHFPYYFIPTWTDCGGYTPPQIPYDRIYVYGTNLCAKTIAHELGHSVGLQHYGNLSWNSNGIRCNPNYASFMSYMYDGTQFDDITKIHPGFSTTAKSSAQKLNPKALVERDGLGSTYSNMDTPDFINNIFHNGTNFGVLLPCVGVCQVDWNNDMSFSLGEEVRAPILLNRECKNNSRFNSTVMKSHSTPNTFYGTPKLVRMGQYVYLFYIDSDRKLYYRIASINTVSSGYGEFGSCQVGQDSFGATCLTWGSPIQVPNVGNHASFPNGGHFVNLSVQSLESQGYFELLLTYNYSEYPLYTINPSPIHKHYAIRTVSFNSQNGAIRWESAPTFLVQNTTSEEGELVNLSVNTSVSSSEKVLAYIYLDEDVYKYKYFIRGSSVWLSGSVEGVGGSSIKGKLGAGLVTWPDSNLSDSKTCGVFMDINKRMSFYCYEKTSNKWKFYPQAFTYALNNIQSVAKPSASFYHKRLKNGSIMPLSLNSGEIWIGIVGNPSKRGVLFRTEHLSTTSIPTYLIKRPALTISNDRKIPDGTGVFLYQDTEISAMKGVWIERRSQTSSQTNFDNLMFFPFVDATFDVELKTGNDFRVMERNICYGLHRSEYTDSNGDVDLVADADSFCGTFSNSYWGY